jgi:cell division control protein 45
MDTDLKLQLRDKLEEIAPEYGLVELAFPSFVRCFGYRSRPLSAADTCEAAAALLDVAGGVRMEVEKEGARNGGEWFGGAHVWRLETEAEWEEDKRNTNANGMVNGPGSAKEGEAEGEQKPEVQWWVRNFWSAYDSLDESVAFLSCVYSNLT